MDKTGFKNHFSHKEKLEDDKENQYHILKSDKQQFIIIFLKQIENFHQNNGTF